MGDYRLVTCRGSKSYNKGFGYFYLLAGEDANWESFITFFRSNTDSGQLIPAEFFDKYFKAQRITFLIANESATKKTCRNISTNNISDNGTAGRR